VAVTVNIRQAGRQIAVEQGRTILESALEQGVAYPHGCRSGRCGSCKTRLIEGEVELLPHTPYALTPAERASGLILACRAQPRTNVAVAWLGKQEEVYAPRVFRARVVALDDATHDIRRVRLVSEDGAPLAFNAGQYARLSFGGAPARDYSMANQPADCILEFHVQRVSDGVTSAWVANGLALGDQVTVEGPFGSSYLRQRHTGPMLLVAGGSGMAPMKSIVETALDYGFSQPIVFYFGAHEARDFYLGEYFEQLRARHHNLSFVPLLTQGSSHLHRTGLISDVIAADLADLSGWKAYMAGPTAMIDVAAPMLMQHGLAEADLHVNAFVTPKVTPSADFGTSQ
jgi:naphthalene 1,2-dioxygenase ferredoxin reductase component